MYRAAPATDQPMAPNTNQKPAARAGSAERARPLREPTDPAQPVSTERPAGEAPRAKPASAPKPTPSTPGSRSATGEPSQRPPSSDTRRDKPVLASEALRDDLAPVDPLAGTARIWAALAGLAFLALAFAPASLAGVPGSHPGHTTAHVVFGVAALAAGALPLRYAWRALVLVFVAVAVGLLGIAGLGPGAAVSFVPGEWGLLHLLAGIALPAALLFRARYRAFRGARVILLAALLLTLPYAGYAGYAVASGPTLVVRIVSAAAILVVLLSLLGFMGAETTGGGNAMATLQLVAVSTQLVASLAAAVKLAGQPLFGLGAVGSVAAFGVATTIGALGVFQLLAWRLGPQARSVDTSVRLPTERPRKHSMVDWLTRG